MILHECTRPFSKRLSAPRNQTISTAPPLLCFLLSNETNSTDSTPCMRLKRRLKQQQYCASTTSQFPNVRTCMSGNTLKNASLSMPARELLLPPPPPPNDDLSPGSFPPTPPRRPPKEEAPSPAFLCSASPASSPDVGEVLTSSAKLVSWLALPAVPAEAEVAVVPELEGGARLLSILAAIVGFTDCALAKRNCRCRRLTSPCLHLLSSSFIWRPKTTYRSSKQYSTYYEVLSVCDVVERRMYARCKKLPVTSIVHINLKVGGTVSTVLRPAIADTYLILRTS